MPRENKAFDLNTKQWAKLLYFHEKIDNEVNALVNKSRPVNFYHATAILSAVYTVVVCLSVCLSVCGSVTLRYCIKTAKRRITQITPHDSAVSLVF